MRCVCSGVQRPQPSGRLLLPSVWSLGLEHQHHLGACEECSVSGPAQDLLNQNLHFDKMIPMHNKVQEPFSEDKVNTAGVTLWLPPPRWRFPTMAAPLNSLGSF